MLTESFKRKLEEVKAAAQAKRQTAEEPKFFPSMRQFMSEKERQMISSAQSRAMTQWWQALSAEQRLEIGRRMSEGRARATHIRKETA
jgi:hypothetical protein